MPDVLTYAQGQTATLTAGFSTISGMAVDVPDATIKAIGQGGSVVLAPHPMIRLYTGFYYYDWAIPNTLPVDVYTVIVTGTVMGVENLSPTYLNVIPAGSPTPVSPSQREIGMIDALNSYIGCANHIPVYNELARRNAGRNKYFFTWPRWNLGANEIRRNGEIITAGFTLDYESATVTFVTPQHDTDKIMASYNWRFLTTNEMLRFLNDALSQINIQAPGTGYTLDTVPDNYVGVLMMGAVKNAMKHLIMCLSFQEPATIFGTMENAKAAIDNFKSLKENNEKEFAEEKKQVKRQRYVAISAVVTPEYTLPGGRSLAPNTISSYYVDGTASNMTIERAFDLFKYGKSMSVLARTKWGNVFTPIARIWDSGEKLAYRLETELGVIVVGSAEHLFLVNGKYLPLAEMRPGDRLQGIDGADEVSRIVETSGYMHMYDIEAPVTANFFANGILCHNSRWFRYLFSSGGG